MTIRRSADKTSNSASFKTYIAIRFAIGFPLFLAFMACAFVFDQLILAWFVNYTAAVLILLWDIFRARGAIKSVLDDLRALDKSSFEKRIPFVFIAFAFGQVAAIFTFLGMVLLNVALNTASPIGNTSEPHGILMAMGFLLLSSLPFVLTVIGIAYIQKSK